MPLAVQVTAGCRPFLLPVAIQGFAVEIRLGDEGGIEALRGNLHGGGQVGDRRAFVAEAPEGFAGRSQRHIAGYGWAVLVDPAVAGTPQSKGTIQWSGAYGHNWFVDPVENITVMAMTNTPFEGM